MTSSKVTSTAEEGFEVQNASIGMVATEVTQQVRCETLTMKKDRLTALVTWVSLDVHEVFETPVLLGITKVEFDLKA